MKYRTFHITEKWLAKRGACGNGIAFFSKHFPTGLTISNSQDEMNELIANLVSGVDIDIYDLVQSIQWLTMQGSKVYQCNCVYSLSNLQSTDLDVLGVALSDAPCLHP